MTIAPVLQYDRVARFYTAGQPAIADVSFAMHSEEVVALLGRNGAGKTTLIHLAMGMLFPHRGTVRVFGVSPTDEPVAVKQRIGYVAEQQVLPPRMRIGEVLAFHQRVFPTWDDALERQLLDRFELVGNRSRIAELSKGQARQVALVCAVCHRPELLILDEPAGGLDPAARREFLETSIQLLNREGTAILFSSHHMTDVERLGGRVVVLSDGRVALDETLDELRERHCVAVVSRRSIPDADRLSRVHGCLHVRAMHGDWHAVFRGEPSVVRARLHRELGLAGASCASVPLEELFVDLLGGARPAVVS
jgi:ABC-2 type transport system ATP-binding protein